MLRHHAKQAQAVATVGPLTYHLRAQSHRERVMDELAAAGVTWYGRQKLESRYLPNVIHEDEHVMAAIYGDSDVGSVMLVATDRRIIYLDKKPLFVNEDEITYDVVSGVRHWYGGFKTTVTLHSRVKDYTINTINDVAATKFVEYIEKHRLEQTARGGQDDHAASQWQL